MIEHLGWRGKEKYRKKLKRISMISFLFHVFISRQVRCIHFQYAHEAGSGRLYLLTVPIENEKEDNKHMLWQMIHSEDKVSNQMLPARVSVHSSVAYDVST